MEDKQKNKWMTFVLIVTAIAGFINLLIVQRFWWMSIVYAMGMPISIWIISHAYDLAKWGNKWYSWRYYKDKPSHSNEPSNFAIFKVKLSGWVVYCLLLFLSILSNILMPITF